MTGEIDLLENIETVRQRIATAAQKRGISPESIALVAVTKTVSPEKINLAIQHGIKLIGENKIQEARDKFTQLNYPVKKHMIGHLQRNKVKYAVKMFDMIQIYWMHLKSSKRSIFIGAIGLIFALAIISGSFIYINTLKIVSSLKISIILKPKGLLGYFRM